ncbi:hypothetical protein SLEP1_g14275 [Rubroshorea leprosula]|uniref:Uncharacterized protein n=1 Tax=Rubroshorea leprosula TaxID=152421 RepID=A0AAV5ISB8_9ROSI|nr:hypothetical protein SLEP1_g14275 [Rubroshorea leprosula]
MDRNWNVGLEKERGSVSQEMFLARGLGVDGGIGGLGGDGGGDGGGGGTGRLNPSGSGREGGDNHGVEEYYERMVEQNPGEPLFLRNYAQFLLETMKHLFWSRGVLLSSHISRSYRW